MTIYGPDRIVACPHCNGLAKHMTLKSGNTFGSSLWTDGKHVAPMLPMPPEVVKCGHCGECYWLASAKVVDAVYSLGAPDDPAWNSAHFVQEPTEAEYYEAISKGLATEPKQERLARILAWWRRNDVVRDALWLNAPSAPSDSQGWRANLEALQGLLNDADENDLLMKAEVLRELGEFDQAQQVLARVTSDTCASVAGQLRGLCELRDACVRQLRIDPPKRNVAEEERLKAEKERLRKAQAPLQLVKTCAERVTAGETLGWEEAKQVMPRDIVEVLTATIKAYNWPAEIVPTAAAAALVGVIRDQLSVSRQAVAAFEQFRTQQTALTTFLEHALKDSSAEVWRYRVRNLRQPPRFAP